MLCIVASFIYLSISVSTEDHLRSDCCALKFSPSFKAEIGFFNFFYNELKSAFPQHLEGFLKFL